MIRWSSGMPGSSIEREPAAMMQWSNSIEVPSTSIVFGVVKLQRSGDHLDLAALGEAGESAGELVDDLVLPGASRSEVDLRPRRTKSPNSAASSASVIIRAACSKRLGGDAADVEADAAEGLVSARPEPPRGRGRRPGRPRCSRRARSRAQPDAAAAAGAAGVGAGARFGLRTRPVESRSARRPPPSSSPPREPHDRGALADRVADRDQDLLDRAVARARGRPSSPCRTRASAADPRPDLVADRDQQLDHRDVGEVADVGNLDRAQPNRQGRSGGSPRAP